MNKRRQKLTKCQKEFLCNRNYDADNNREYREFRRHSQSYLCGLPALALNP